MVNVVVSGGLYPSDSLYPSESLYPDGTPVPTSVTVAAPEGSLLVSLTAGVASAGVSAPAGKAQALRRQFVSMTLAVSSRSLTLATQSRTFVVAADTAVLVPA
jgi:hypothetical protein